MLFRVSCVPHSGVILSEVRTRRLPNGVEEPALSLPKGPLSAHEAPFDPFIAAAAPSSLPLLETGNSKLETGSLFPRHPQQPTHNRCPLFRKIAVGRRSVCSSIPILRVRQIAFLAMKVRMHPGNRPDPRHVGPIREPSSNLPWRPTTTPQAQDPAP